MTSMAGNVLLLPNIRYKVVTATWKSPVGHLKCGPKGMDHVSGQMSHHSSKYTENTHICIHIYLYVKYKTYTDMLNIKTGKY